jgi:hypothetical protein
VTFTVTVDPANAFGYRLDQYKGLLMSDVAEALKAGASLVAATARANMQANGNVDTGALSASINTLNVEQDDVHALVEVGPSLTEMHPARFNPVKTYNDIGAFLEFGTGPGGPWSWGGVAGSRWEGFFTRSWTGNAAYPFMTPALTTQAPAIVDLVAQAVSRRW